MWPEYGQRHRSPYQRNRKLLLSKQWILFGKWSSILLPWASFLVKILHKLSVQKYMFVLVKPFIPGVPVVVGVGQFKVSWKGTVVSQPRVIVSVLMTGDTEASDQNRNCKLGCY